MFEGYRIQGNIPQAAESSPVLAEGQYFARQNTKTTFTPAITPPVVENIVGKLCKIYVDTTWATLGTTIKTILRKFDIQIMTGVHPKMLGSANKYFDNHGEGFIKAVCTFVVEGDSTADDISDLAAAATLSFLRFEVEGSQIGAGDNHNLTLDMAGFWNNPIKMAEVEAGNNLHSIQFETIYDPTGAKTFEAFVTTDVTAI
jgi:hypothetical protein